ncbi:MAG: hypothetical protein M3N41_09255 [Acidobacteriota bacterium]|nr:hypothetical protein [Acidobacteriota bacterium]
MTGWTLGIDFKMAMMYRVYQSIGITNRARNLGGSLGISAISVIVSRRAQYHQTVLASHTSQYDATFQQTVASLTQTFQTLGADVAHATTMAQQMIYASCSARQLCSDISTRFSSSQ